MESITFSNVLSSGVFRALSELVFSEAPPPPPFGGWVRAETDWQKGSSTAAVVRGLFC